MNPQFLLIFSALIALTTAASKWYDGPNRPYEFGYRVEQNQHRFEKKDEQGIIMGEFGFITADGVYHVTVYATDENGNFKILSMKQLRNAALEMMKQLPVPPSPPPPSASPAATPPIKIVQSTPAPFTVKTTTTQANGNGGKGGCANCVIPNPPTSQLPTSQPPTNQPPPAPQDDQSDSIQPPKPSRTQLPPRSGENLDTTIKSVTPFMIVKTDRPGNPTAATVLTTQGQSPQDVPPPSQGPSEGSQQQPQGQEEQQGGGFRGGADGEQEQGQGGEQQQQQQEGGFNFSAGSGARQGKSGDAGEAISVGIGGRSEYSATPPKVSDIQMVEAMKDLLMEILYRFNYTVGFHGHNEVGYRNGHKEGQYFSVSRDGIKRVVSYNANDRGFQPTLRSQPAPPEEVPSPDTEKDNRRHDYEFKWFFKNLQKK